VEKATQVGKKTVFLLKSLDKDRQIQAKNNNLNNIKMKILALVR